MWRLRSSGIRLGVATWRDRKHCTHRSKNVHSDWSYKCIPSTVNVFWKRCNVDWPFRGEPSSGHAVPTAAVCSVRCYGSKCLVTSVPWRHLASWWPEDSHTSSPSATPVHSYQTTRCHNPEGHNMNLQHCQNVKCNSNAESWNTDGT